MATVVAGPGTGTLQATVTTLSPDTPAPSYTYKWYRDGTAIAGATASTYKLVTADYTKPISVKITMNRLNFVIPSQTLDSTAADYSLFATATEPTI